MRPALALLACFGLLVSGQLAGAVGAAAAEPDRTYVTRHFGSTNPDTGATETLRYEKPRRWETDRWSWRRFSVSQGYTERGIWVDLDPGRNTIQDVRQYRRHLQDVRSYHERLWEVDRDRPGRQVRWIYTYFDGAQAPSPMRVDFTLMHQNTIEMYTPMGALERVRPVLRHFRTTMRMIH